MSLVNCAALRQLGGDSHLTKDVTQQVFTALANKAPSLSRDTMVLAAWLYVTAHYTVANVRRAERRRQIQEHEAFLMRANLSDTPSADDWSRIRPVPDEAVLTLRPADREAILLRFFSDSPFADFKSNAGVVVAHLSVRQKFGIQRTGARTRRQNELP